MVMVTAMRRRMVMVTAMVVTVMATLLLPLTQRRVVTA